MKTVFKSVLLLVVLGVAYLSLWPVPINPVVWDAPPAVPLEGDFAANDALSSFDALSLDGLHGPEAVVDDGDGTVYATTHEGWILRWSADTQEPQIQQWVNVGGRPLGLAFDDSGNLWVANAYLGLQKVTPEGQVSVELDQVEGTPILYADDLDITSANKVYFSDASMRFSPVEYGGTLEASLFDINEHSATGRIIQFDIDSGEAQVVMSGLSFANGVALSPQEDFILVAETGEYRIWKHWIAGDKAGTSEIVVPNLPGFPDNVHLGHDGRFWVGLTSPRSKPLDDVADKPFLRKLTQRLPASLRPGVVAYGHVLAIDANGQILANLQDPNKQYAATTGAWETAQHVYVSSLTEPVLARYNKAELGL